MMGAAFLGFVFGCVVGAGLAALWLIPELAEAEDLIKKLANKLGYLA